MIRNYKPDYGADDAGAPRDSVTVPASTIFANQIAKRGPNQAVAAPPAEKETLPKVNIFSVAPDWVALRTRDDELTTREAELVAEAAVVQKEINKQHLESWTAFNRIVPAEQTAAPNKAAEAGLKLLGKFAAGASPKADSPAPVVVPPLILRRSAIAEELDAIKEARALLAPQIRAAFLDGSRRLRDQIKPEFDKLQREVFLALVTLGEAMLRYDAFMTSHRNAALSLLRPVIGPLQSGGVCGLGDPRDRISTMRIFLQQAIDSGHMSQKDLPRTWSGVDPNNVRRWFSPY